MAPDGFAWRNRPFICVTVVSATSTATGGDLYPFGTYASGEEFARRSSRDEYIARAERLRRDIDKLRRDLRYASEALWRLLATRRGESAQELRAMTRPPRAAQPRTRPASNAWMVHRLRCPTRPVMRALPDMKTRTA